MREKLFKRWLQFWRRIEAAGNPIRAFDEIIRCYEEKHRAYHVPSHIDQCLNELEMIRQTLNDPDVVELSIWFHDSVYITTARLAAMFNEELSAGKADEFMQRHLCWDILREARVEEYIIETKNHARHVEPITNSDCRHFLDIDMSILGQPDAIFDAYEKGIRYEYRHVPWEKFAKIRGKFVHEWLEKARENRLFLTDFFRAKYNEQAKRNLARALLNLNAISKTLRDEKGENKHG